MADPTGTTQPASVPLCVDLDGTLIKTDMMWESIKALLRRNPLWLFAILFWWSRGRAHLKYQLAGHVTLDPAGLPYNEPFLEFLRTEKRVGRKLVLASASDRGMVEPVAKHLGLFDEILGSDGKTNLRGAAKLKALTERFGKRGFDYAGNSSVDLTVWRGSREAIVVNAGPLLARRAAKLTKVGRTFLKPPMTTRVSSTLKAFWSWRCLLAAVAGLLLAGAFPNVGVAGFAWIAPALMIGAALDRNGGDAFRIGYVAGLTFWLASLYWLLLIPVAWFPILGWLSLSAYVALYPAVWVWLVSQTLPCSLIRTRLQPGDHDASSHSAAAAASLTHREAVETANIIRSRTNTGLKPGANESQNVWSQRALWAISGAAAWVALEMLRAWLFTGFPWNPLGASQYKMLPLIQIASITGMYGVSFIVVWASLSLLLAGFFVIRHPTRRAAWAGEIILPLAVVMALFIFGNRRLAEIPAQARELNVAFIQPSIPQTMIWDEKENANRFRQLVALSEKALSPGRDALPRISDDRQAVPTEPKVLIWPEAALPTFDEATYNAITNLVRAHRVWMIFGADDVAARAGSSTQDYFNAAFLINPNGEFVASYRKRALVVFGEYIPLVRWLPFVKWFTPITGGFTPGTGNVPFVLKDLGIKTAVLICFEDIFPGLARESVDDDTDFLLNLTNNGWFGEGAAQWQHAAAAIFRAVENGLPLLRCSNNGLTCWVDECGRLRQIFSDQNGKIYGEGFMTVQIPLPAVETRATTFYHRHGDWFGWACVGVAIATAFVAARRKSGK